MKTPTGLTNIKRKNVFSGALYNLLTAALNMHRVSSIRHHPLYSILLNETSFLPLGSKILQRLWHIQNNTKIIPICKAEVCATNVNWICGKYRMFCSTKCSANDFTKQEKIKQTTLKNHGVENPSQSAKVKEKKRQTTLKNYGVENPSQSAKVKEKKRQTKFKRHGDENYNNKESQKQTMIERHGVHPMQSKEIRKKYERTVVERHGVENPSQSIKIKEKKKHTSLKNYGTEHPAQKHLSKFCLEKINDRDWLNEEYNIKKRTISDISNELQIDDTSLANYLRKFGFYIRRTGNYSYKCIHWLESIMKKENTYIQHAQNIGEYKIPGTRFHVDGYCEKTNTIYEFYGDFHHGNLNKFHSDHMIFYTTAEEKYQNTMKREKIIRELGYNLVTIWESEWGSH